MEFKEGNKAAEKWTEETVMPILQSMVKTLTEGLEDVNGNLVRANDIKLSGEIRLMYGVTKQRWSEWREKFKENAIVSDLIEQIDEILECRLIYSGGRMDEFVLKNKYGYADKQEVDHTTKGESFKETGIENLSNEEKLQLALLKRKMRDA